MVLVGLFVGVNLISPINKAVETLNQNTEVVQSTPINNDLYTETTPTPETVSSAVKNLSSLPVMIFVVVLILMGVKAMEFDGGKSVKRKEKIKRIFKNSKEFILRIESESSKYKKFIQNLDELLDVTTVTIEKPNEPLTLIYDTYPDIKGRKNQLNISEEYDWYVVDKHPEFYMFKVVGLHKSNSEKNTAYILGVESDKAYIIRIPNEYLETNINSLVKTDWWKNNKNIAVV